MDHRGLKFRREHANSDDHQLVVVDHRDERGVGRRARGWLSSSLRSTTRPADFCAEAGLIYFTDVMNDDQPYMLKTDHGPIVAVPYTVEMNDFQSSAVVPGIYTVWLEGESGDPYFQRHHVPVPVRIQTDANNDGDYNDGGDNGGGKAHDYDGDGIVLPTGPPAYRLQRLGGPLVLVFGGLFLLGAIGITARRLLVLDLGEGHAAEDLPELGDHLLWTALPETAHPIFPAESGAVWLDVEDPDEWKSIESDDRSRLEGASRVVFQNVEMLFDEPSRWRRLLAFGETLAREQG